MADPVLQYAGAAKTYGGQYGIPPSILLGLVSVESGGNMAAVSPAGARGGTQFMPATRESFVRRYGIDPWRSAGEAIHATAIYLRDLGYKSNPKLALARYNGGTNPPASSFGYADDVQKAAAKYGSGGATGDFLAADDPRGQGHALGGGADAQAGGVAGSLATGPSKLAAELIKGVVDALGVNGAKIAVTVGLIGGAAVLAIVGIGRATGLKPGQAIAKTAAVAVPK